MTDSRDELTEEERGFVIGAALIGADADGLEEVAAGQCGEAIAELRGPSPVARAGGPARVAAEAALALAVGMAEKIVTGSIALDPSLTAAVVGEALAESRARAGPITVRLHPDDLAAVERERPALAARVARGIEVRLLTDEAVGR